MPYASAADRKYYQGKYRPEWQKANRPLLRVYATRYRMKHPERLLLINARERAKRRGLEFTLTEADIVIPATCPILGIPIFLKEVTHKKNCSPNSPSIDRIDSNRGYVKGNIHVISWRANLLKNNGTLDEFRKIVEFLARRQEN